MGSLKRARDNVNYPMPYPKRRTLPSSWYTTNSVSPVVYNSTRSRVYSRRSNNSLRGGPYRVLTSNQRHTNPLYPRPELKIFDCDQAATTPPPTPAVLTNIPNSGAVVCINAVPTGTSVSNFLGNQVSIKSVGYRVELDLGTTPVPTSGRVLLIYDKQPNGTLAAWTDIFTSAQYLAYGNPNTRERFVILRNDQFSLSPQGDQTLFYDRYVKVNMTTTYASGSPGTVPQTGAILLAYISDQPTAANQPRISANIRTRFYDN